MSKNKNKNKAPAPKAPTPPKSTVPATPTMGEAAMAGFIEMSAAPSARASEAGRSFIFMCDLRSEGNIKGNAIFPLAH